MKLQIMMDEWIPRRTHLQVPIVVHDEHFLLFLPSLGGNSDKTSLCPSLVVDRPEPLFLPTTNDETCSGHEESHLDTREGVDLRMGVSKGSHERYLDERW